MEAEPDPTSLPHSASPHSEQKMLSPLRCRVSQRVSSSSRRLPLNLSLPPFSHGEPGSMIWIKIKDRWGLNMNQAEVDAIRAELAGC